MTTDYVAWEDGPTQLDTDSKRRLEMDIYLVPGKSYIEEAEKDCPMSMHYVSDRLTEDQIVEIGVNILGPAFYFTDDEDGLVRKIKEEFSKRGFTCKF